MGCHFKQAQLRHTGTESVFRVGRPRLEQQHLICISVAAGALEKDVACGLRDMQGIVRGMELMSANTSELLCAIYV